MGERDTVENARYMLDDYKFLENAYGGTGGFKNGEYLIPYPRENKLPEKFLGRKRLAYYLNYFSPILDSHVNPLFREEPSRDWKGNSKFFDYFLQDVDKRGNSMSKFMRKATKSAKLYRVVFIIMDNSPNQPTSVADAKKSRAFPYAYLLKPSQITDYDVDMFGNFTMIAYNVNSGKNKTDTWKWTAETWQVYRSDGSNESGVNTIGKVPVIAYYSSDPDDGETMPQSEFYSIAQVCRRIYNLCSEIDELIRSQAFAVMTYPQTEADIDLPNELVKGTEYVLGYNGQLSSNKPEFTAPPADNLQQLREERASLVQEIYRMAERSHVTGVTDAKSGVAKAWDFEQANTSLSNSANQCEKIEMAIAEMFKLWANESFDYRVKYSDDFGIVDVTAELDQVGVALGLNIGGRFNIESKKKAVYALFRDLDTEAFDTIMSDIDARALDETYSDQTFNGAQVDAVVTILTAVSAKQIAAESARAVLMAFFGIDEIRANEIIQAQSTIDIPQQVPQIPVVGISNGG